MLAKEIAPAPARVPPLDWTSVLNDLFQNIDPIFEMIILRHDHDEGLGRFSWKTATLSSKHPMPTAPVFPMPPPLEFLDEAITAGTVALIKITPKYWPKMIGKVIAEKNKIEKLITKE